MAEIKTATWDLNARIEQEFTDPVKGWIAEAGGELADALANATRSLTNGHAVRPARLVQAKTRQALVENVRFRAASSSWMAALNSVRADVLNLLWSLDGLDAANAHERANEQERLRAYGRFLAQTDVLLSELAAKTCEGIKLEMAGRLAHDDWQFEADGLQTGILGLIAAGAPGAAALAELALRADGDRVRHYCGGTL